MAIPSLAFTSAGTTLAIGPAPTTYDAGGFAAVSFVEVAEITDIGEFGKKFKLIEHNPIGSRGTVKRKGSYNNGTLSLKLARATSDPGQADLILASESDLSYSFRIVLNDEPTFTEVYFTGQVMGYTTMISGVDTITAVSVDIEIDNDIILVS